MTGSYLFKKGAVRRNIDIFPSNRGKQIGASELLVVPTNPVKPETRVGPLFSGSPNSTAQRGLGQGSQPSVKGHRFPRCSVFSAESRKNRKTRSVLTNHPAPLSETAVQEKSTATRLSGFSEYTQFAYPFSANSKNIFSFTGSLSLL